LAQIGGVRVLFLPAFGREGASSRFRVYQYLEPLRAAGWRVRAIPPPGRSRRSRSWHSVRAITGALGADVVVLQKRLIGRALGALVRVNSRLVYDLDDAIWAEQPGVAAPAYEMARRRTNLHRVASRALVVSVGNEYLARYFAGVARDVTIVPTAVDADRFRPAPRTGGPVVIGWVGNPENLLYLEPLGPVFTRLAQALPGRFVLRVVSRSPASVPAGVPHEFRRWSLEREVEELQQFDIGIMPLADDEWARGKCGLKAIQYMSVGAAAVVSPVGANREIVAHGVDGLWAQTPDDWFRQLHRLVVDGGERRRLAEAALNVVAERYSLRSVFPSLADLLQDVAGRT
jgi:glycosyltransferase involved in cell wall biosynthesis